MEFNITSKIHPNTAERCSLSKRVLSRLFINCMVVHVSSLERCPYLTVEFFQKEQDFNVVCLLIRVSSLERCPYLGRGVLCIIISASRSINEDWFDISGQ